jgi:hypothetical protein
VRTTMISCSQAAKQLWEYLDGPSTRQTGPWSRSTCRGAGGAAVSWSSRAAAPPAVDFGQRRRDEPRQKQPGGMGFTTT